MTRVATYLEKSGENEFLSRSVNCQGILKNGQWKNIFKKSQGKMKVWLDVLNF